MVVLPLLPLGRLDRRGKERKTGMIQVPERVVKPGAWRCHLQHDRRITSDTSRDQTDTDTCTNDLAPGDLPPTIWRSDGT